MSANDIKVIKGSPSNILAVNEVPFENVHVKDVQVKGVGLNAVELTIGSYLWLALVEVGLGPRFAVQLLNFVRVSVE